MTLSEMYKLLSCKNDEDLLRKFPIKYDSLETTKIDDIPQENKRYVFKGIPEQVVVLSKYNKDLIRFKLNMADKVISCLLYKQPFYLPKILKRDPLIFVLYYSDTRKLYVVNSIYDTDSLYALSGIKPVYSLAKGIQVSYFTNQIKKILSSTKIYSFKWKIPLKYVKKYNFIEEGLAYKYIHLPKDKDELYKGQRLLKYEEALSFFVSSLKMKKDVEEKKNKEIRSIDHNKINDFVKTLNYKLTKDQSVAIKEIVSDMEANKRMYRLLQGDVSTGKTLVAFVSLYANYLRGKQGVMVSPTFELTKQHFENSLKVFNSLNIRIKLLTSALTTKQREEVLNEIKENKVDIVFSTHSVFSDDIQFSSLGLAVIDEQQLFGVKQREMVLSKGECTDLLMMSATPIPRTLSQIINSDVDVSTLSEYPIGIRNVETRLINSTDPILHKAILKAISSNRQVFIIAPKIFEGKSSSASAESIYEKMKELYGEDKVQLIHGKIKKEERDSIYQKFLNNEKPILVSTTVIEVGIDVSSAGLLVVYDANYFGLSSLHQLRGRIGRSGQYALALLIYDGSDQEAKDKLDFLAKTNNGLSISEYDLLHRGPGDYWGERQSGSKSFLKITNFVLDQKIFAYAKSDAIEILNNLSDKDNKNFYDSIILDNETLLA